MTKQFEGCRVFLSGPMTNVMFNNAPAFAKAHARLKELGTSAVYDPALNWLVEAGEVDAAQCMTRCLLDLLQGKWDCVVLLSGWSESEGSSLEAAVAKACGIPWVSEDEIWDIG